MFKKGNLSSLPFLLTALSSLPKFLFHNLNKSKFISSINSAYPLFKACLYLAYPQNISSAPNPLNSTRVSTLY